MAQLAQLGQLEQLAQLGKLGELVQPVVPDVGFQEVMMPVIRWLTRLPDEPRALVFRPDDFEPRLQTRLLILQSTPFCNIRCDYCYLPDRDSRTRMELKTVGQTMRRLRDDGLLGPALTVVWHAGEPLTPPPGFYDAAISLIKEMAGSECEVSQSLQTNAMLIDDAWCELFKRHQVRVGVSVDGPAALHNARRRTRRGQGTHERVLRGIDRLHAHGIDFHAIAVVTGDTFEHADEFLDFFVKQGIHQVGCNFDEMEGLHRASSLEGREAAHGSFLEKLLERSQQSGGRIEVRELVHATRLIARPLPTYRRGGREWPDNTQVLPFAMASVGWSGNFGTFSPELLGQPSDRYNGFRLGNVASDGFFESAQREPFLSMWNSIIQGTDTCQRECAHFTYCGGGAPVNKLFENGDMRSGETLYCRTMIKRPFDTV